MNDKIYEVISEIEKTDLCERISRIKQELKENKMSKKLIDEFNDAKESYEKYNYSDEFIKSKIKLMKDPVIKKYLDIQNEINMISLYINNKIEEITKNTI